MNSITKNQLNELIYDNLFRASSIPFKKRCTDFVDLLISKDLIKIEEYKNDIQNKLLLWVKKNDPDNKKLISFIKRTTFETKKDFNRLSEKHLSENFIRKFQDKLDWNSISEFQNLSENFIREFQDKLDWNSISEFQKLSENFIREFQNKVNWFYISEFQKLSENFIREFQDKVNWFFISCNQKLSENFIREFQDKVNWERISEFQKLSENFVKEFKDKINMKLYTQNKNNRIKNSINELLDS